MLFGLIIVCAALQGTAELLDGFTSFYGWVIIWYKSVNSRSSGPWLLLMDNFSGLDSAPNQKGVTFWYFSQNSTYKFQPIDQGMNRSVKISIRKFFFAGKLKHYEQYAMKWITDNSHGSSTKVRQVSPMVERRTLMMQCKLWKRHGPRLMLR